MIRIVRAAEPDVLARSAGGARTALEARYDGDPQAYLDGRRTLTSQDAVWGHVDVRLTLRAMQHSKCCYCEVQMDEYTPRHVEHWRPKAGVRQGKGSPELKPGYYWLAYAWHNLFLACQVCNSRYKGVLFPIEDPARRARSHDDILSDEAPLLLRPDVDDPHLHMEWLGDQPRGLTEQGWTTIEVVGLVRDNDSRRIKALKRLEIAHRRLSKTYSHPDFQDEAHEFLNELREAKRVESEFSAMTNAYLATLTFPNGWAP